MAIQRGYGSDNYRPEVFERLRAGNTARSYAGAVRAVKVRTTKEGVALGSKEDTSV